MIHVKKSVKYYINERALTFSENDLNDPQRVAVSLVSGTVIMVREPGIIDYASDGNFEKWTLKGYSTKLVNNALHYVYARLSRTDRTALIVFSVKDYNIDGSITTITGRDENGNDITETTDPSADYFYIKIGELTATDTNRTTPRELTYDSGLLSTKKGDSMTESSNMWELLPGTNPLIKALHWLTDFTVKGFITLIGGLKFSKGKKGDEKVITDVKRSVDSDNEYVLDWEGNPIEDIEGNPIPNPNYVPASDEVLVTAKYVKSLQENKYLRKDQNDNTEFTLGVGKLKLEEKLISGFIRSGDEMESDDESFYSSLRVDRKIEELDKKFLRKDKDDNTEFSLGVGGDFSVSGNANVKGDLSTEGNLSSAGNFEFKTKVISGFTRFYDEKKPEDASDAEFYSALMTDKRIEEYLDKLDEKYLRKDKEDTAHKHITFEEGITVYGLAEMMNLEVKQLATIARAIVKAGEGMEESISSEKFVDGFFGEGFRIWRDIAAGEWSMTLDRLTVRKVMTIYELIVQKIRSVGGMIVVSAGNGKIKEVKTVGLEYLLTFEDTNSFVVNDLIRCQVFTGDNLKHYWVEVTGVKDDGVYVRVADFEGVIPEAGDEVVLMGNTRNRRRQNLILISATEDGQPRFDCYDGVSTKNFENCLKVRVGALDGIVDSRFPDNLQPEGYGLYGNNCYLTGVFVLSNGTDVQTQFAILEGQIVTEISSVRAEINDKDNYLSNASFGHDLEKWSYENEVRIFDTEGGLLHFNNEFYSDKQKFAGIVKKDTRNVLRIKKSWIKQLNDNLNMKPTFELFEQTGTDKNGNEISLGEKYRPRMFYVSFNYLVAKSGTLTVRFSGESVLDDFEEYSPIDYTADLGETNSYSMIEIEGKWNGTGDFELTFDGDIYIYGLALADNRLADMEEKFNARFEMTDKKIQANLDHIIENKNLLEEYHGEFLLTAKELTTSFDYKIQDQYSKITSEYTSKVTQTAQSLTSDYTQKVTDNYNKVTSEYSSQIKQTAQEITATLKAEIDDTEAGLKSDYEARISATAQELTSDYTAVVKDLKDGTIHEMQSNITQQAGLIATKVSQTDFDALGTRVSFAETDIVQNSQAIELRATKSEFETLGKRVSVNEANIKLNEEGIEMNVSEISELGAKYASLKLTVEGLTTRIQDAEGNISTLTQTTEGLQVRVSDAEGNVSTLTQTAEGLQSEISDVKGNVSTLTQTAEGLQSEISDVKGNVSTLTQTAEGLQTKVLDVEGNYASLSVRVGAIESVVGDGEEGDFEGFKQALEELTDDITANTKAAAAAQKTADEAKGLSASNLTRIEQTEEDIEALAATITTDDEGNIVNISTSGLVLDSEFATLFSTEVNAQGVAKTAQLNAYVKEDELGNLVSKMEISADQIDLTGKVKFSDFDTSLQGTIDGKVDTTTIISGGYIKTSLIDVDRLTARYVSTGNDDEGYSIEIGDGVLSMKGNQAQEGVRLSAFELYFKDNDGTVRAQMTQNRIRFTPASSPEINIGYGRIDLGAGGRIIFDGNGGHIQGLAIGNFHGMADGSDYATLSSDGTLPNASFWPGKILFVRTVGERQIKSSSTNILPRGSNTLVSSLTRNNSSQFFISNGENWIEFFCGN